MVIGKKELSILAQAMGEEYTENPDAFMLARYAQLEYFDFINCLSLEEKLNPNFQCRYYIDRIWLYKYDRKNSIYKYMQILTLH